MREDWIESTIGDVCFTTSGGTPSRRKPEYYDGDIPWVKSGELNHNVIKDTEEHISEDAIKGSSAKLFPKGTLLIALYGATIGKLAVLGVPATTNQAVCGIFENSLFETKFLYYYLFHKKQELIKQGAGGAQPNISQTILKKLSVPIVPLPEQRTIVSKIEELFSELDNGIENLNKAKEKLEIYRQAVLKKAFEGAFVTRNKVDELPEGWNSVKVNSLCEVVRGGSPRPAGDKRFYEGPIPFLKVADLTKNNEMYVRKSTYSVKEAGLKKTRFVNKNTLLLTNSGATLGVPKVCTFDTTFNDGIAAFLNLDEDLIKYCYYFWCSKTRELRNINQGAAQPNLNTNIIGSFSIPIGPKEDMLITVQEIDTRLSECDNILQNVQYSIEQSEALRQSILKRAFEGKLLTKEELDQCRKEFDWEPAEKLLERIKK